MKSSRLCVSYLVLCTSAIISLIVPASAQVVPARSRREVDLTSLRLVDRIADAIDDRSTVVRPGNRHPMALPPYDLGSSPSEHRMERMILLLEPDPRQQQVLEELLAAQRDPQSPHYREWLTPESFGEFFGVSDRDVNQITAWLDKHGFDVEPVSAARRFLRGVSCRVRACRTVEGTPS